MKETAIEKKVPSPLKEKGQYVLGFSIIALMLYVANFSIFLLFFIGVLAFFVWKVFSSDSRLESRRIFEFYLSANEILREDDRRWYGFEIQETIARGESIVRSMSAAPPLVYFSLGALYQKLDDHSLAVKNLAEVVEGPSSSETTIVYPSKELREYVRTLRKIERFPAEAPLTSSAVRSLERARKNRGRSLLDHSRSQLGPNVAELTQGDRKPGSIVDPDVYDDVEGAAADRSDTDRENRSAGTISRDESHPTYTGFVKGNEAGAKETDSSPAGRKTISEVLHDIYDDNIQ